MVRKLKSRHNIKKIHRQHLLLWKFFSFWPISILAQENFLKRIFIYFLSNTWLLFLFFKCLKPIRGSNKRRKGKTFSFLNNTYMSMTLHLISNVLFSSYKSNSTIRLYTSNIIYVLQRTKMSEREWANSSTTSPISDSHQPIHLSCKPTALYKEIGRGKGAHKYNACSIILSFSHG